MLQLPVRPANRCCSSGKKTLLGKGLGSGVCVGVCVYLTNEDVPDLTFIRQLPSLIFDHEHQECTKVL